MKPVIGITANSDRQSSKIHRTNTDYINCIINSGGIPLLIPSNTAIEDCDKIIMLLDGILIPGGSDIAPTLYNEEPLPQVTYTRINSDKFEIALINKVVEYKKPILGICRGAQLINVAFGGSLYQDIPNQLKDAIGHVQSRESADDAVHSVKLKAGSHIHKIFSKENIHVNTLHHQAIKDVGKGLNVTGTAIDGVIESIETDDGNVLAVQWHPERLTQNYPEQQKLFDEFINRCQHYTNLY